MIKGRMNIELEDPEKTSKSINSDNLANINSFVDENTLITEFSFENIGQTISSLDDLIKCIDVSREVIDEWKK